MTDPKPPGANMSSGMPDPWIWWWILIPFTVANGTVLLIGIDGFDGRKIEEIIIRLLIS
jgi:hypothetical protein